MHGLGRPRSVDMRGPAHDHADLGPVFADIIRYLRRRSGGSGRAADRGSRPGRRPRGLPRQHLGRFGGGAADLDAGQACRRGVRPRPRRRSRSPRSSPAYRTLPVPFWAAISRRISPLVKPDGRISSTSFPGSTCRSWRAARARTGASRAASAASGSAVRRVCTATAVPLSSIHESAAGPERRTRSASSARTAAMSARTGWRAACGAPSRQRSRPYWPYMARSGIRVSTSNPVRAVTNATGRPVMIATEPTRCPSPASAPNISGSGCAWSGQPRSVTARRRSQTPAGRAAGR